MAPISCTLPLPAKVFGSGLWRRPKNFGNHDAARRLGEQAHLFQLILEIGLAEVELNDHRTFTGGGSFNHARIRNGEDAARLQGGPRAECRLFGRLFLLEVDRARRHDGGDGVLVDHLGDGVLEQHDVLVEGFDLALQLDAVDQVDRDGDMLATKRVEEGVL
jgi:hypothetical protein